MECEAARYDSFNKAKRTKPSLTRSTSGNTLKWPHPLSYLATPRTLAEAGFYYDPGPEDHDNVTCFMCGKQLNEWEPDDDPFLLHFTKCNRQCAWASVRCGPEVEKGRDGQYRFADSSRVPTSKIMEKARLETFTTKKRWPHDTIKGHGASSKNMAKAGFAYTPGHVGDDSAACLYCGIVLNGWDEDDDPTDEHVKRAKKSGMSCAFLNASTTSRTIPKASSRINNFSHTMAPSSDDELAASIASAYNSKNTSRSTRSSANRVSTVKTPASGSRRSTRGTGSRITPLTGSEVDDTEAGSGSEAGRRVSRTKGKRKGTAANKAKDLMKVVEEEEEPGPDGHNEEVEIVPPPKPKRGHGRPPKHKTTESAVEDTEAEPEPAPAKKGHGRTRSKANLASDSDVPQPQASGSKSGTRRKTAASAKETHIADTEDEQIQDEPVAKPGRKRTKKGEDSEPPSDAPGPTRTKGAKGRTVSRSKAKRIVLAESSSDVEMLPEEEPPRISMSKPTNPSMRAIFSVGEGSKNIQEVDLSASDDAGYTTAEPKSRHLREGPSRISSGTKSGKGVRAFEPEPEPQNNDDIEMVDHAAALRKDKQKHKTWRSPPGSTSSELGSRTKVVLKKLSHASLKSKVSRSSSSATKIVEISDDEDDDVPPPRSIRKGVIAPSMSERRTSQGELVVHKRLSQSSVGQNGVSTKEKPQHPVTVLPMRSFEPSARPGSPRSGKGKKLQTGALTLAKPNNGSRDSAKGAGPVSSAVAKADPADGGLAAVINGKHGTISTLPPSNRGVVSASSPPASPPPSASPDHHLMTDQDEDDASAFTPLLSSIPLQQLASFTDEECAMTVEQWIRREIEIQSQMLKEDAETHLAMVIEKAVEMRRIIEAL